MVRPDLVETVLLLILGWLVGILSPPIVDWIRRHREVEEVKIALKTELHELQYRLATAVHLIEKHFGEINREKLEWLQKILKGYRGINPSEDILKNVESLLSLSDGQIATIAQTTKAAPDKTLSLRKYVIPFLDSKIVALSWLNEDLRNRLLELKTHLGLLNEEIDHERFFFRLTFQDNLGKENWERANEIVTACHKNYAVRARMIIDQIKKIQL